MNIRSMPWTLLVLLGMHGSLQAAEPKEEEPSYTCSWPVVAQCKRSYTSFTAAFVDFAAAFVTVGLAGFGYNKCTPVEGVAKETGQRECGHLHHRGVCDGNCQLNPAGGLQWRCRREADPGPR